MFEGGGEAVERLFEGMVRQVGLLTASPDFCFAVGCS
jgi:hypothetical protein